MIQLEKIHDILRARFNEYTKRAFKLLPDMKEPSILDIGCGSGIPTIELVNLSNGHVTAIDIDKSKLERLSESAKKAGISEQIKVIQCSMLNLGFPDNSFDLIWAEGAVAGIGFERSIKEWRRLIKPNGFLVIHDDSGDIEQKTSQIEHRSYKLIDHFTIPGDIWWSEYYEPLEKHIAQLRSESQDDPVIRDRLDHEQSIVEKVKRNPESFGSTFFIMQKTGKA